MKTHKEIQRICSAGKIGKLESAKCRQGCGDRGAFCTVAGGTGCEALFKALAPLGLINYTYRLLDPAVLLQGIDLKELSQSLGAG